MNPKIFLIASAVTFHDTAFRSSDKINDVIPFGAPRDLLLHNLDNRAFEWYSGELRQLPESAIIFIASNNPDEYPENATIINVMDLKK